MLQTGEVVDPLMRRMSMNNLNKGSIVVVLVVVIALLGGVLAGFVIFPLVSSDGRTAAALGASVPSSHEPVANKEAVQQPGIMYPLKERVVNLGDTNGLRYLKIEVVLEFEVPDAKGLKGEAYKKRQDDFIREMSSRRPIMDDIVTMILAGKTSASLSTVEGKEQLREELKNKLAEATGEHKLINVYLTQFIIQ